MIQPSKWRPNATYSRYYDTIPWNNIPGDGPMLRRYFDIILWCNLPTGGPMLPWCQVTILQVMAPCYQGTRTPFSGTTFQARAQWYQGTRTPFSGTTFQVLAQCYHGTCAVLAQGTVGYCENVAPPSKTELHHVYNGSCLGYIRKAWVGPLGAWPILPKPNMVGTYPDTWLSFIESHVWTHIHACSKCIILYIAQAIIIVQFKNCPTYFFLLQVNNKAYHELQWLCVYSCAWHGQELY